MTSILREIVGHRPEEGNVHDVIVMAGQRLRWNVAAEQSTESIYTAVAQYTPADIEALRQKSPWIRAEERRPVTDEWHRPDATELELARVAVEAVFDPAIDWRNYDVTITPDPAPEEQYYKFCGKPYILPLRESAVVKVPYIRTASLMALVPICLERKGCGQKLRHSSSQL